MVRPKHPAQSASIDKGPLELAVLDSGRDRRLVALIRMVARRAARKAYREMLEERRIAYIKWGLPMSYRSAKTRVATGLKGTEAKFWPIPDREVGNGSLSDAANSSPRNCRAAVDRGCVKTFCRQRNEQLGTRHGWHCECKESVGGVR